MKGFRDSSLRKLIDDFININRDDVLIKEITSHTDRQLLKAFCLILLEDFQREIIYKNNQEYSFDDEYVEIDDERELIDIL